MFIPDSARTVRSIAPAIAAEDVITTGCDTRGSRCRSTPPRRSSHRAAARHRLWDSPDLVDERSGVARYVQCSIFVDVFFANSERPATKKFVDDFSSAYKRAPLNRGARLRRGGNPQADHRGSQAALARRPAGGPRVPGQALRRRRRRHRLRPRPRGAEAVLLALGQSRQHRRVRPGRPTSGPPRRTLGRRSWTSDAVGPPECELAHEPSEATGTTLGSGRGCS